MNFIKSLTLGLLVVGSVKAQTNPINVLPPQYNFLTGQASYTDTTNTLCPAVRLAGYYYPSNFVGVTHWQFNPNIVTGTNPIIKFRFLSTNISTVITGYYRLVFYTNNVVAPYYDSGDTAFSGNAPSYDTNINVVTITNNFSPLVLSNKSSLISGMVYFKSVTVSTNQYSQWLLGGSIQFP